MSLKAVGGEINSQVLNDNFSYLESSKMNHHGLKEFDMANAQQVYLYDLNLGIGTVNQTISVDENVNEIYATQAYTFSGDKEESFVISRLTLNGNLLDSMTVRFGGHGTTIGLERVGGTMYIWSNMLKVDSNGNQVTQYLTRYPYRGGTEININSSSVEKFTEFPNSKIYMSPFTDSKNGLIAFRHTNTTSGSPVSYVEVRKLSDVKARIENVLYRYDYPSSMNNQVIQGMCLDGNNLYLTFGQVANDFTLYQIDVSKKQIVDVFQNPVGKSGTNSYEEDFGEPEGLFLYTDPYTGYKTLLCVVVTDATGRRRQKLFAFSSNVGVDKFIGYAAERTQNIKLTRDDGKCHRITSTGVTALKDLRVPGLYYAATNEADALSDFPSSRKGLAGWWITVSGKDTDSGVYQELTRNSRATPERIFRTVGSDGAVSDWILISGTVIV
ncbi:phage baseplate protein [Mesobacillus foraminis]|uniref:P68 RBP/TagC-like beta-propeller domain-containing protein n=1 Tax=Mesobacillus foraminis TaxID=279826 RepID=A0A4R2BF98_9BACI|nr:hypothetical protein [Mesobacillus foraminis]TCN25476.1 hypothetical protein EV146_105133 [Mesobacillus foraminis]